MLPDLPRLKSDLASIQLRFVRWSARQQMPAFGESPQHPVFEGSHLGVEQASGDSNTDTLDQFKMSIALNRADDDLEAVWLKLYEMAEQLASQLETKGFERLNQSCARTGNAVNGKGKRFAEGVLELLEKIEMPLNDQGEVDLSGMRFVVGDELFSKAPAEMERLAATPELQSRLGEIMAQKKEQALAREANRKLVG